MGNNQIIYDKSKIVNKLETESKVVEKKGTTSSLSDLFTISNKHAKKTLLTVLGIVIVIIVILFIILKVIRYKRRKRYYSSRRRTRNITNAYKHYRKD